MAKAKAKKSGWQNRIVESGAMAADQFLAHEKNARRHPGKQRDALRGSLNSVGWIAPVIVSARTGKLLDGHARIEEALSKDDQQPVPFVKVDVSEAEEALILASFDPITGLAVYDREALDALLRETSTGDVALQELLAELATKQGLNRQSLDFMTGESDDGGMPAQPQAESKFPLAIILTAQQNRQWQARKQELGTMGDTEAFLKLWQS